MSTVGLWAPFYGLASALLFALSNHFTHLGLEGSDARTGTLISIASAGAIYWLLSPFFLMRGYWLTTACLLFVVVGIFRPVMSSALAAYSIKMMGPTLSSALTAVTPLFGAVFAITLLGERITLPVAIGTLSIVAGAVIAAWKPQGMNRTWPLWAIALPLGAAFIRGAGHAVTKIGLAEVPSASFAVLVSNTVSMVAGVALFRAQGRPIRGSPQSHLWFVASGVSVALSLQFLNNGLLAGDMVSVVPLVSATPLFTLALGYFWFGRETITSRTILTVALIVPGVVLVALGGHR